MRMQTTVLVFLLATLPGAAQDFSKVHFVRATGEAKVSAHPDRAQISIGIVNQASAAQAAASANAAQTAQVLDSVKRTLGDGGELRTAGYSISPQYAYKTGQSPTITGYQASNTVLVIVNNLTLLGKIIDSASGAGANNIGSIDFSLKDDSATRNEAIAEATTKARAAAESMARALNVRVVGVLMAATGQASSIRPLARSFAPMAMPAAGAPTPVETGDIQIGATVTVTLEVQ